jgi:hypothetical protein
MNKVKMEESPITNNNKVNKRKWMLKGQGAERVGNRLCVHRQVSVYSGQPF